MLESWHCVCPRTPQDKEVDGACLQLLSSCGSCNLDLLGMSSVSCTWVCCLCLQFLRPMCGIKAEAAVWHLCDSCPALHGFTSGSCQSALQPARLCCTVQRSKPAVHSQHHSQPASLPTYTPNHYQMCVDMSVYIPQRSPCLHPPWLLPPYAPDPFVLYPHASVGAAAGV